MSPFSIKPGRLVAFEEQDWLVEEVEGFERVLAKRIEGGHREFLPIALLKPPIWQGEDDDKDPKRRKVRKLFEEELLSEKQTRERAVMVDRFQALLKIADMPKGERAAAIREYCETFGCKTSMAYYHLGWVRKNRSADALVHAERADKGRAKQSKRASEIIVDHLARFRLIPEAHTIPDVLERINHALSQEGLPEISRATLYRRLGLTPHRDQLIAQGRKKEARDNYRPRTAHLPDADFPLAIAQVDHSPVQICFVDAEYRRPIGDGWLTIVIDCYSRMVLGFALGFDAPSTLTTGLALAHAILPKDKYLADLGVKGSWPCWGVPDVILVDNAVELNGNMMHSARRRYRFDLRDRPLATPQFGAHVESAFKTFMHEIKTVPGTKFSNPVERAEYDSEGKAIMTLAAFEQYFTEFLVNDYHLKEHRGDGMDGRAPLQRWQAGIFDGDVREPVGLPEVPSNPEELRISFLPLHMRILSNARVRLFGHEEYYGAGLKGLSDELDPRGSEDSRKVEVRYDPRDISCVWVLSRASGAYIKALNVKASFRPISLREHIARKKAQSGQTDVFKDERREGKKRRDEIKAEQTALTKQARRESEKRRRNAALALTVNSKVAPPVAQPEPVRPVFDAERLARIRARIITTAHTPEEE